MFKVGLTGGIGAGKSLVADLLVSHGATVIDTDQVSRNLTAVGGRAMPAIQAAFGEQAMGGDGALDRQFMRELVFANPDARKTLESILHPMIREEVAVLADAATGCYLVFDVPLLVESGRWVDQVDRVCVIDCEPETQIQRVMARSGLSRAQVENILKVQASRAQRLAAADDVIINDSVTTIEEVRKQVLVLHQRWCNLAIC